MAEGSVFIEQWMRLTIVNDREIDSQNQNRKKMALSISSIDRTQSDYVLTKAPERKFHVDDRSVTIFRITMDPTNLVQLIRHHVF